MDIAHRLVRGVMKMPDIGRHEVGQGRVLGVAPEGLDRVPVGRQQFDRELTGPASPKAVDRGTICIEASEHSHDQPAAVAIQRMETVDHMEWVEEKAELYLPSARRNGQIADRLIAIALASNLLRSRALGVQVWRFSDQKRKLASSSQTMVACRIPSPHVDPRPVLLA